MSDEEKLDLSGNLRGNPEAERQFREARALIARLYPEPAVSAAPKQERSVKVAEALGKFEGTLGALRAEYADKYRVFQAEMMRPMGERIAEVIEFHGSDIEADRRIAQDAVFFQQKAREDELWSLKQGIDFLASVAKQLRGIRSDEDARKVFLAWQAQAAAELSAAFEAHQTLEGDPGGDTVRKSQARDSWLAQKYRMESLSELLKTL